MFLDNFVVSGVAFNDQCDNGMTEFLPVPSAEAADSCGSVRGCRGNPIEKLG